jgi:hypothetical protein
MMELERDDIARQEFEQDLLSVILKHEINTKTNIPDIILVKNIINTINQLQQFDADMSDFYESEITYDSDDGDHASALASAGWGTDEDYGSADNY